MKRGLTKGFEMKKLVKLGGLVLALSGVMAIPLGAQPPEPPNNMSGTNQGMGHHQQMKAMRQQMAADIKAQDAELEQLVTQMNSASADQKVDAIAAVVNKLVEDRLALHNQLESMHQQMGGHMHMGGTNGATGQGMGGTPQQP
jgi:hypothetical protein